MDYQKFITPAIISMLITYGVLAILLLCIGSLIFIKRKSEWVKSLLWLPKELIKIYSNEDSYFSKKRIESGIAFFSAIGSDLCFVWIRRHTLTNSEYLMHLVILLGIAGYVVSQIQKEKETKPDPNTEVK